MPGIVRALDGVKARLLVDPYPATGSDARRVLLLVGLGIAGFALTLFRVPLDSWDVLWAEDGAVYLDAVLRGSQWELFAPYAGYLQFAPRTAAALAGYLPLPFAPTALLLLAAVLLAALGVAVFVFAEHLIAALPLRLAVWLSFVALPLGGGEVLDNVANTHWFLLAAAVWAVVIVPRSPAVSAIAATVVGVAILSDPIALGVVPVVVLRVALTRRRADIVLLAVTIAAAIAQVATMLAVAGSDQSREFATTRPGLGRLVDYYGVRVALEALGGVSGAEAALVHIPVSAGGLALGVVAVVLAAGVIRDPRRRPVIIALGAASVGITVALVALQWHVLEPIALGDLAVGSRYALVGVLLLLAALLVSADALIGTLRQRGALIVGVAIAVLVAIPAVRDYRVWDARAGAPDWAPQLEELHDDCATGATGGERPEIAPDFFHGPFVPCDALD